MRDLLSNIIIIILMVSSFTMKGQSQSEYCLFDVVRIENTTNGIEVTVKVFQQSKAPSITILNCGDTKIKVPLPPHFVKSGLFTYKVKGAKCNCSGAIEYNLYSSSPNCTKINKLPSSYCDDKVEPIIKTEYIDREVEKIVYKDVERIVHVLPPCHTCSNPLKCFSECFICWFFGFLVGIYLLFRVLFIAEDKNWDFWVFGSVSKPHLWEATFGAISIAIIASCPCQSALMGIVCLIVSGLIIVFSLFKKEEKYPEWKSGLLVAGGIIIALISIIGLNCN